MKRPTAALLLAAIVAALALGLWAWLRPRPLVVCADPNNLPFSNRAGEGFENRLAALLGAELHRPVRYVWWAQRRGFVRSTIGGGSCDLWPGVSTGLDRLATSRPYYRSTYMFVTRGDAGLSGLTLDDPRLRRLRLGVQMIGNNGGNTPPAHALSRRGIIANVRGFMLYGDYRTPNPPTAILRAVADRDIDVGLVWGPLAGWYAQHSPVKLRLEPVTPWLDGMQWPMIYEISVGVGKDDPKLLKAINAVLARRRADIARLLQDYGVPQVG
ncbi:MAG: quinoprotein dehydrogenase-associated putative ABC transporter substrate-binding protein [Novosphingobium sp.]|nr:quinoprotein dehydrogenase-associated putative ABC transporter substrate-binding protein [Novosphingobium sp.]